MIKNKNICLLYIASWILLLLPACNTITEDLEPCSSTLTFRYDYNMKFVDAFPQEVKKIDVYVFDEHNRYITTLSEERNLGDGSLSIPLDLPEGKYHFIAWAGLYPESYDFAHSFDTQNLTPEKLHVKVLRNQNGIQNSQLEDLWHGETTVELNYDESRIIVIELTKDTNRFRVIVQGTEGMDLDASDIQVSITDNNGWLAADNSLLPDDEITYLPYYQAITDVSSTADKKQSAMVSELNTLRLVETQHPRMLIRTSSGKVLVDIDLIKYLLLTKMEGHQMPPQEYLDRQDEYALIFFLNKDTFGNYLLVQIKINGWIIRPQSGDL
ncbi:secreted protein containing DUF1812 [gut metagenome]|uniref:Secreted protein containing DUF1812 n=1 Tax=gut metagenome TaxID=749906 RepID=J9G8K5_9ZZZZ